MIEVKKNWVWGCHMGIREKLGLPEDASDEAVKQALLEWKEENSGYKEHGFKSCGK